MISGHLRGLTTRVQDELSVPTGRYGDTASRGGTPGKVTTESQVTRAKRRKNGKLFNQQDVLANLNGAGNKGERRAGYLWCFQSGGFRKRQRASGGREGQDQCTNTLNFTLVGGQAQRSKVLCNKDSDTRENSLVVAASLELSVLNVLMRAEAKSKILK